MIVVPIAGEKGVRYNFSTVTDIIGQTLSVLKLIISAT